MATYYEFHSEIGRGGFGIVYEAEQLPEGWPCVAKTVRKTATKRDRQRFRREVRLQAKLDHANIVPVLAMNLEDTDPWFIMPPAEENLREYLDRAGPGPERLWAFEQVCEGIAYAHTNGVIHRDIKPQNVLIFEGDGEEGPSLYAAVGDFGLGTFLSRDSTPLTPTNTALGTINYAAPEQWVDAKNVDQRADIYSLGKLLFEVLTGVVPYPDASIDWGALPQGFDYVVRRAIETNPDDRYPTVAALQADVNFARNAEIELQRPVDAANELIQAVVRRGVYGRASLQKLVDFLDRHLDDTQLLVQVVPRIPAPVLKGLTNHHSASFWRIFEAYDSEMGGSLPFEYCDIVADFYEAVFEASSDARVRTLILRRLPILGYEHNRWHVGSVVGRIAGSLTDAGLVLALRNAFLANPDAARWCSDYLPADVPSAIRSVVGLTR